MQQKTKYYVFEKKIQIGCWADSWEEAEEILRDEKNGYDTECTTVPADTTRFCVRLLDMDGNKPFATPKEIEAEARGETLD